MCKLKCNCGGAVNVSVNSNKFAAQCKGCQYGISGELSHTSTDQPVEGRAILWHIARIWVEFGSGSVDGDWHADISEVKLNNCNIGKNFMRSLLLTRDDFPGWFGNKEDLKNV